MQNNTLKGKRIQLKSLYAVIHCGKWYNCGIIMVYCTDFSVSRVLKK